jgi:hypothetical protein
MKKGIVVSGDGTSSAKKFFDFQLTLKAEREYKR